MWNFRILEFARGVAEPVLAGAVIVAIFAIFL
jgi:hypothetical protein